ncbi:unnamed protein product [Nesidiocoris tenuis]|uniref:Secreted protein n=1 Tax=Nesidiocoris tenuis TaxID=355587 RepID=A0A6H5HFS6_9HEMI|nr:unnamed protein product [Nesidiocoris tenuis]
MRLRLTQCILNVMFLSSSFAKTPLRYDILSKNETRPQTHVIRLFEKSIKKWLCLHCSVMCLVRRTSGSNPEKIFWR